MRRSALFLALVTLTACAHNSGPPHQPWDQWTKPEGTEQQRAADYADCVSQGKAWGFG